MLKNKSRVAIALFLVLSFAISLFAVLPNVQGQIKTVPDRPTGAYLSVNPPLLGSGQPLTVNIQIYPSPAGPNIEMGSNFLYAGTTGYDGKPLYGMHFEGVTVTFTRPDGSKDTFMPLDGSFAAVNTKAGQTEEVGTMWFTYDAEQIGDWTVQFSFSGQSFTVLNWTVKYLPSSSQVVKFTVQEDAVQIGYPPVPLPTGYWIKPISPVNREWSEIGGDWLDNTVWKGRSTFIGGGSNMATTAPNSPHILWKFNAGSGSAAGISSFDDPHDTFAFSGGTASISRIWAGRLYFTATDPVNGTQIVCADQYTGKIIWQRPGSISTMIATSQSETAFSEFSGNPSATIWYMTSSGWYQYNPWTGAQSSSILPATGQSALTGGTWDDAYRYVFFLSQGTWSGTTFRRSSNRLIGWNMSKTGNWNQRIMWNVSMIQPDGTGPGMGSRGSQLFALNAYNQVIVATIADNHYYIYDMDTGAQLYIEDIGFQAMSDIGWTEDNRFLAWNSADNTLHCFDVGVHPWRELWVTTAPSMGAWTATKQVVQSQGYGNVYTGGMDGHVRAFDLATGDLEWDWFIGNTTELPWGTWGIYYGAGGSFTVADGKVYVSTSEHTPSQPMYRGMKMACLDAFTGEELWRLTGWYSAVGPVASGYLYMGDAYLGQTYCIGKGQTETAVSVSTDVITEGSSVLVKGSVLDMSPAQPGTAAIADVDMSVWMDYLHLQNASLINGPPNPNGVEVSLDAVDPNNNFVHIGTTTSDSSGLFSYLWEPEVPGKYTVYATFAGSESYWASYAETAVGVVEAPAAPPAEQPVTVPDYTWTIVGVGIAVIVAVAIVGILILTKKP